jgi:predicted DNA-binding ribbon-helix-helix protein
MKVKVTITLEDKSWQRLRMQALKDKTSASAIIDRLVADYLKSPKKGGE